MIKAGKRSRTWEDEAADYDDDDGAAARPETGTDSFIKTVLEEEEQAKQAGKSHRPGKKEKGLTLEEVETAEGGVVRESAVGMAQTKRAARRKGKQAAAADDTELVPDSDVVRVEEALEVAEEDGIALEPFNLKRERAEGHFDESGHYVEHGRDDAASRDAWLDSATVISEDLRKTLEQRNTAAAAADEAPPMSAAERRQHSAVIAEILETGETVTRALKRLGAQKAARQRLGKRQPSSGEVAQPPLSEDEQKAVQAQFDRLTEAASALMDSGDLDVYSQDKAAFDKAAKPGAGDMFADSDDDVDDMFASARAALSATEHAAVASNGNAHATDERGGDPGAEHAEPGASQPPAWEPGHAASEQPAVAVDYSSWPVKELKRFLTERGEDASQIVEKDDLVARVNELASRGPEGEDAAAPAGYVLDPASGYYYSEAAGMYYDASSGGYYDGQKWYSFDAASQQFTEWPT